MWHYALQGMVKFPHVLCVGNFGETNTFLTVSYGEMEISVSLQFPRENCPYPVNFHATTMGKFSYFLLWSQATSFAGIKIATPENSQTKNIVFKELLTNYHHAPQVNLAMQLLT